MQLSAAAAATAAVEVAALGDDETALVDLTMNKMTLDEDLSPRRKRKRSNAVLVRVEPPKKTPRAHRRNQHRPSSPVVDDDETPTEVEDESATTTSTSPSTTTEEPELVN